MRFILKLIIMILLGFLIIAVTIIPKIISYLWYGGWNIQNHGQENYWESIGSVILTIIEDE